MKSRNLAALTLFALAFVSFPLSLDVTLKASSVKSQDQPFPLIKKVELDKKKLTVEGENFAPGATILVNGVRQKTVNDDLLPSKILIAVKAGKKIARKEVVALEVQNPDGVTSAQFGFFTGFTFNSQTTAPGGEVILKRGQKFLIHFNDPGWRWYFREFGAPDKVEYVSDAGSLLPEAHGIYLARRRGYNYLLMIREPRCPPNCSIPLPMPWFVNINVE